LQQNDFISNWVSILQGPHDKAVDANEFDQLALLQSAKNCLTFPWIADSIAAGELQLHLWYFDIQEGCISAYSEQSEKFQPLG
jgi:carbonic anhydrase